MKGRLSTPVEASCSLKTLVEECLPTPEPSQPLQVAPVSPKAEPGGDADALGSVARALRRSWPALSWLGLQDVGLTPAHRLLLKGAVKARAKKGLPAVEVESSANNAAKQLKKSAREISHSGETTVRRPGTPHSTVSCCLLLSCHYMVLCCYALVMHCKRCW